MSRSSIDGEDIAGMTRESWEASKNVSFTWLGAMQLYNIPFRLIIAIRQRLDEDDGDVGEFFWICGCFFRPQCMIFFDDISFSSGDNDICLL